MLSKVWVEPMVSNVVGSRFRTTKTSWSFPVLVHDGRCGRQAELFHVHAVMLADCLGVVDEVGHLDPVPETHLPHDVALGQVALGEALLLQPPPALVDLPNQLLRLGLAQHIV